mmetsp:Transcript_50973/g.75634  ORF Transcript_50973/g.75634 Transcript_50973/m.75634 type:complete len:94 (+) Transcript_50973:596-877(+)
MDQLRLSNATVARGIVTSEWVVGYILWRLVNVNFSQTLAACRGGMITILHEWHQWSVACLKTNWTQHFNYTLFLFFVIFLLVPEIAVVSRGYF